MLIQDQLKKDMFEAMKVADTIAKEILQVVIGEIETKQSRGGVTLPTDEVYNIIRKMITSNKEVIEQRVKLGHVIEAAKLETENEILKKYLPLEMTVNDLILSEDVERMVNSFTDKNLGKLIGIIVSHFKNLGIYVDGKNAKIAIERLKSGTN